MFDITCVIPARLNSTRLPAKILADLLGKPVIRRVYESALKVPFKEVVIAVDAQETFDLVSSFGARAVMTSSDCQSGTDRVIELLLRGEIKGERFVNWQGDEPFVTPEMIASLMSGYGDIWTLKKKITDLSVIHNPNCVKVVADKNGHALYFSRAPIPYGAAGSYKHIGIYGYTREALLKIKDFSPSPLEEMERLEQLRFLDNGLKIRVNETDEEVCDINTQEDLDKAIAFLSRGTCGSC